MTQQTALGAAIKNVPFHIKGSDAETVTWSIGPGDQSEVKILASGVETGLQMTVAEHTFPAGSSAGYHAHLNEDEGWYIIEGEITISMPEDDATFVVPAGEFVWKPFKRMHNFEVTSSGPARVLQFLVPGTELMPEFFRSLEGEKGAALESAEDLESFAAESRDRFGLMFGDPDTGASDLPPRTPESRGSESGGKIKYPTPGSREFRICNEPFQSDADDVRTLEIGRGMMKDVKCTFHAFGHQTGNKFGLFEIRWGAGDVAYPHVHTLHEEGFYVADGEMTLCVLSPEGLVEAVAKKGDFVWAPRDMAHYYKITGENGVRAVICEAPGGTLADMFLGISDGQGKDIDSDENLQKFADWTADFVGMHFLAEGEFPGFEPAES